MVPVTGAKGWIDDDGVMRWASIQEAPTQVVQCWAWGHRWEPGPPSSRPGWGRIVEDVTARCACGRVRAETLDPVTGERMSDSQSGQYSEGHGLMSRTIVARAEARAEWMRRARAIAAEIQAAADAQAALEERAALEQHAATRPKRARRPRTATVTDIGSNARRGWPARTAAAVGGS